MNKNYGSVLIMEDLIVMMGKNLHITNMIMQMQQAFQTTGFGKFMKTERIIYGWEHLTGDWIDSIEIRKFFTTIKKNLPILFHQTTFLLLQKIQLEIFG